MDKKKYVLQDNWKWIFFAKFWFRSNLGHFYPPLETVKRNWWCPTKIEGNQVRFFFFFSPLANIFTESYIYFFVEFIFLVRPFRPLHLEKSWDFFLPVKYPFDYFLILNYFHSLLHRYGHFEIRIFPEEERIVEKTSKRFPSFPLSFLFS